MFDKLLATVYLEHRQLTSMPLKVQYIKDNRLTGGIDGLHREMSVVAREFHAMIDRMINETEGE